MSKLGRRKLLQGLFSLGFTPLIEENIAIKANLANPPNVVLSEGLFQMQVILGGLDKSSPKPDSFQTDLRNVCKKIASSSVKISNQLMQDFYSQTMEIIAEYGNNQQFDLAIGAFKTIAKHRNNPAIIAKELVKFADEFVTKQVGKSESRHIEGHHLIPKRTSETRYVISRKRIEIKVQTNWDNHWRKSVVKKTESNILGI